MTEISTWRTRAPRGGQVDFTQMYVAHDAFVRELTRISDAVDRGAGVSRPTRQAWARLTGELHVHHAGEDSLLWPRLRAKRLRPDEELVLNAMEAEHAEIDPLLESLEQDFEAGDFAALRIGMANLRALVTDHMQHEEKHALPLVECHLGRSGWADFSGDVRRASGGIRGGASYLPWVLDGADPEVRARFLGMLPAPARLLYSKVWEPAYRRRSPWTGMQRSR
jgi:hypothetical protein